ncbi:MAG TPA: GNAT family N-acetyltransferase, partial [Candidatus Sulfotelmatobacter sp.]|nr:GNAT family N-acetyltransferase [Candidatus Sulfotelmatobacter sp.]
MSPGKLAIQTYNSIAQLEGIRGQWEDLLAAYPLATTFSTPEWLLPWWRNFGQSQELLVVAAFADASLAGLAALSFTSVRMAGSIPLRVLRLMGDGSHDSDNLDIPVRPGFEDSFAHLLVEVIEKHRSRWDVGYLNSVPPQSTSIDAVRRVLEQRKSVMFEGRTPASAIALPETWEQYLKQLSSKERGKIGLRARRLEKKYAVRIRRCEDEQELDPLLQVLYDLHGKHWQARGLPGTLHVPARRRFYSELAVLLLRRRRLDFWILEADGKVVAAQFGLRHGTTVFSLQEGFDTEYASDSVGYVLRSQVIKELLAQGIRRYDFLGGADE